MKALFGGSSQASNNASGYSALPAALQQAFNPMGQAVAQYTNPNNPGVTAAFTPMPQTAAETGAINNINNGLGVPTADSIKSDIAMQMNPFDDSVISTINQQGQGQYSVLKQALNEAGQNGSNRQALGANDIDLTRMNQIGTFKQGEYNTALNNALTTIPQAQVANAQNVMSAGAFQRALALQTAQAPIAALQAGTSMLAPFVSGGVGSSSGSSTGGIIPGLAGLAKGAGSMGATF